MDPRLEPLKKEMQAILASGRLTNVAKNDKTNARYVQDEIVKFIANLDAYKARQKGAHIYIML